MPSFGATGKYPYGSLGPDDKGELHVGVRTDSDGNVVVNFGTPCEWIAMPPANAIEFAQLIMKHAGVVATTIQLGNRRR